MRAASLVLAGSALLLAACQDTEPTGPLTPQAAIASADLSEQAAVAQQVAAFGGFFIDEAGRPSVYVTDMAQAERVRQSVAGLAAEQGYAADQIVVLQAAFPYAQLQQAFDRATHAVMPLAGSVFTDLDETRNRIVVGVERATLVRGAEQALARAGLTAGSYEVIVTDPIHQVATLRDKFDPTVGGIQIHFSQYVCTLGFNSTDNSGERSFITNSHCTATQGGVEGTVYYQPTSSVDGTVIATEREDPQYFRNGACPRGKKCRYSDSSRAQYSAARSSSLGRIAITSGANNGSLTVAGTATVAGKGSASVGTTVNKVGRTTGWTQAAVTRTCVNTAVSGSNIMQLCQSWVESNKTLVGGGDSGSGVWTGSTSSASIVGILWGGNSSGTTFIFSPMNQIDQELGAQTVK
jgi:hypothetical protein